MRQMTSAAGNSGSGRRYQYHFQDPASLYGAFVQIRKEVPRLGRIITEGTPSGKAQFNPRQSLEYLDEKNGVPTSGWRN